MFRLMVCLSLVSLVTHTGLRAQDIQDVNVVIKTDKGDIELRGLREQSFRLRLQTS